MTTVAIEQLVFPGKDYPFQPQMLEEKPHISEGFKEDLTKEISKVVSILD